MLSSSQERTTVKQPENGSINSMIMETNMSEIGEG